jgi:thioredoxin reductase (NADPH)
VTAAGSGTVAALDAEHYLAGLPNEVLVLAGGGPREPGSPVPVAAAASA